MKKVSILINIFFYIFSIYVCAMHVFVVYIILCNKNLKTLKYRRNDLHVCVYLNYLF